MFLLVFSFLFSGVFDGCMKGKKILLIDFMRCSGLIHFKGCEFDP
jgi:hypothetical protein